MMLFLLVGSGAFIWGVISVLERYYLRDRNVSVEVMVVATMLGASIFSFVAQFILMGAPKILAGFWWPLAMVIPLTIVFVYLEVKALKLEDASIVSAILGITPLFLILTSWLFFRELPTLFGVLGIILIVLGVYTLNLKGITVNLPFVIQRAIPKRLHKNIVLFAAPWIRLFSSKGARLALFIAFLASISLNLDKLVVVNSSPMMRTGGVFMAVAVFVYGMSIITGKWQKSDKSLFLPLFGIGLLLGLSNVLIDWGYLHGIVPYVGALKRTSILWTVILAGVFLREKYTALRLTAAAVIVIGVVLLAF